MASNTFNCDKPNCAKCKFYAWRSEHEHKLASGERTTNIDDHAFLDHCRAFIKGFSGIKDSAGNEIISSS